ncbi:MAG: GNAT family N-acetyltransferase [Actinocrinis sp.]
MYPAMDLTVPTERAGGLRLRTLTSRDADLIVEATRAETRAALWGPRPTGPYSLADAQSALDDWSGLTDGQVSYGVLDQSSDGPRLVGAVGVMPDAPRSAELAYWVRPECRRRGIGLRAVRAVTWWAHEQAGVRRVWLEINPDNDPSRALALRAGFRFEERIAGHCRSWVEDDPARDVRHDCLIWIHESADGYPANS